MTITEPVARVIVELAQQRAALLQAALHGGNAPQDYAEGLCREIIKCHRILLGAATPADAEWLLRSRLQRPAAAAEPPGVDPLESAAFERGRAHGRLEVVARLREQANVLREAARRDPCAVAEHLFKAFALEQVIRWEECTR
jgi:hypothetical protein